MSQIKRHVLLVCAALAAGLLAGCQRPDPSPATPPPAAPSPAPSSSPAAAEIDRRPLIVAFGDSLTAGYGLTAGESYPSLLQRRIDEKHYQFRVVNAGLSGDTSAGGLRRIDQSLKGEVRFLILELGANDALRGQPVADMKKNLAQIIQRAQSHQVTVILAGMEAPPNYGSDYTRDFRATFQELAREYRLQLIPFILAGVGGLAQYNQQDGIHPNVKGVEIVTENVWRVLEPLLAQEN
jgi:acyl-CoA thioesterase-1